MIRRINFDQADGEPINEVYDDKKYTNRKYAPPTFPGGRLTKVSPKGETTDGLRDPGAPLAFFRLGGSRLQ